MIRPVAGMGIVVDENKNGSQISQAEPKTSDGSGGTGSNGGGGSSGTPVNLYGVLNGAPATYHLLQSSAPTPV